MFDFAYLHGKPTSTGLLRSQITDFKVFERLPFEPCGEGEHLLVHIRKTGCNTVFVARQLAKYFGVKEVLVSYAGLKDRFAVTEQWFGVHLPGKQEFDLSDLEIEGVELLSYARHNKKLRTGALTGNRFELVLREVSDVDDVLARWQKISSTGVPNYFGEQRFGIDGNNIEKALALFAGTKVKDKKKRSIYLSAARSLVFNHIVSERIREQHFIEPLNGDVFMLAGTQSVFLADKIDAQIIERLAQKDIDITAPMWGAGNLMTQGQSLLFEQTLAQSYPEICQGLKRFGLKQERRRIRLNISEAEISAEDNNVKLAFFLPAGCYATTVMRELIDYQDMTERVKL